MTYREGRGAELLYMRGIFGILQSNFWDAFSPLEKKMKMVNGTTYLLQLRISEMKLCFTQAPFSTISKTILMRINASGLLLFFFNLSIIFKGRHSKSFLKENGLNPLSGSKYECATYAYRSCSTLPPWC